MTVDKITKEIEHFTSIQKKLDKKGDKLFEKATNESNPEKRAKYREGVSGASPEGSTELGP